MKRTVLLSTVLAASMLLAGCGDKPERAAAAEAVAAPAVRAGFVTMLPDSPKLSQLRVESVVEAAMPSDEVASPGKVEANPNRLSHVVLPVGGRITTVSVRIGDYVQKGQPLLSVESPDVDVAVSSYLQAEAGVTQAQTASTKAQADLDRVRDLFEHNAVAQKEVLNAQALLDQNKAAIAQADASREQARRRLELLGVPPGQFGQKVVIRAPISGKVLEMNVVPGEFRNDTSASLMTIADLSWVWISSDVPESSIRLVRKGERVEIEMAAYPAEQFSGRVTQIADIVDPQTRTVQVRAEMDNRQGRLRPEMFARIRLVGGMEKRPVVRSSAIVQAEDRNTVWKELKRGSFQQIAVTLGPTSGDQITVITGLRTGDRVVTDGVMLLRSN